MKNCGDSRLGLSPELVTRHTYFRYSFRENIPKIPNKPATEKQVSAGPRLQSLVIGQPDERSRMLSRVASQSSRWPAPHRIERLPWLLASKLGGGQMAEFVVHQRHELGGSGQVAALHLLQDLGYFIHGGPCD